MRCCIDYRQLDTVTTKDAYPLPRIDSCHDAMVFDVRPMLVVSKKILVAPEESDKTAFICPRGMYRFKTMPLGLCDAGATFEGSRTL